MINEDNSGSDISNTFYPVVTGSYGDIQIGYRQGRREVKSPGEDVDVPVEAVQTSTRQGTPTGYDIFLRGQLVSSVVEKDFSKVAKGPLDYYVRRYLKEEKSVR